MNSCPACEHNPKILIKELLGISMFRCSNCGTLISREPKKNWFFQFAFTLIVSMGAIAIIMRTERLSCFSEKWSVEMVAALTIGLLLIAAMQYINIRGRNLIQVNNESVHLYKGWGAFKLTATILLSSASGVVLYMAANWLSHAL